MKNFKAIITEKNCSQLGLVLANTKSSGQYKGMNKEQFTKATRCISAFTIEIIEM
jgi:hypothetical protein